MDSSLKTVVIVTSIVVVGVVLISAFSPQLQSAEDDVAGGFTGVVSNGVANVVESPLVVIGKAFAIVGNDMQNLFNTLVGRPTNTYDPATNTFTQDSP